MTKPNCAECTLQGRDRIVNKGKKKNATVVFVGEAPGYVEAKGGVPFVGKAGKLLSKVVRHSGIIESNCLFTNLVLCHPPENRDPSTLEINCCWERLVDDIKKADPKLVVALGAVPAKALLKTYTKINDVRGSIQETKIGYPCYVVNHPASMLYPGGEGLFPTFLRDIQRIRDFILGVLPGVEEKNTTVAYITKDEDMAKLLQRLSEVPVVSYDWETTGVNPRTDRGYCLGLSWHPNTAAVIPVEMVRKYRQELSEALSRDDLTLVAFNAAFDLKFNVVEGLPALVDDDPMLMHYMLDERPQQRSLENLAVDYLNLPRYETEMLSKYQCKKDEMIEKIPPKVIYEYNGKDADYTLRLYHLFQKELEKRLRLYKVYKLIVMPAARAFSEIQENGMWVDQGMLERITEDYKQKIKMGEDKLKTITQDRDFNPRSHKQVQEFLWDKLCLPQPDLHKRKDRSADAQTLDSLLDNPLTAHEFVKELKTYRGLYTVYSRYLRPMPEFIGEDSRIRCQWHLDRTETGRLSTTKPAIHQVPRDSNIRSIFGAPPGKSLIQADYSQIEMRMAAHIAKDKKLTELFKTGMDFHSLMASEAFKIPLVEVTPEKRNAAKAVSFGLLYLMGDKTLAENTGLPPREAAKFVQSYKKRMPQVQEWIDKIKQEVLNDHYVESIFGRRRRFLLVTKDNVNNLQREAVNMPVQSSASDLTLWNVIELHNIFREDYPEVKIVAMVHDSIIVECPQELLKEISQIMYDKMTTPPFETEVPFPVEIIIGKRWGEGSEADF